MKKLYFLAGLPRSGSTVLAALLNQHPELHTTATSGLLGILTAMLRAWEECEPARIGTDRIPQEKGDAIKALCEVKCRDTDKNIILNKERGWVKAQNMHTMEMALGYPPKIIATVRNVEDCVASMVRIAKPNELSSFLRESSYVKHIQESYVDLLKAHHWKREYIYYVDYDELNNNPEETLRGIEKFLELSPHTYDTDNIDATGLHEKDEEVWGIKGLHDVRKQLKQAIVPSAQDVLQHLYRDFVQPRFWQGETSSRLPIHKLDMMLAAGLLGNLDEAAKLGDELGREEPRNDRAAFNRGWYELRRGKLLDGHRLLIRGRNEDVFGNPNPSSPVPLWDGKSKGTVLLNLEGGLGDQIHGAGMVRYIVNKGCEVIVACSPELASLFRDIPGVSAVVVTEAAGGVVHDFWVPAMSAVIPLELQYADVDGSSYISKPLTPLNKKLRIGLRWQGNPKFEHEQHRLFPSSKLFDAVKDIEADFISLQRDEGSQHKPEWVKEVPLQHWGDTRHAIATCDLVITSCTSVAHLSAAMGVDTWILVPILPYYLWAKPGNKSEWYDSVTLFRQTTYGDWDEPFERVKENLGDTHGYKNRILDSSCRRPSERSLGHHAA